MLKLGKKKNKKIKNPPEEEGKKPQNPIEEYSKEYRNKPIPKDIDLDRFVEICDFKDEIFGNMEYGKASNTTLKPLEEQLRDFNSVDVGKRVKKYPID